jgi:hypothetical protein
VELEDALAIMDYIGLEPENPSEIDCSKSSIIIQLRAKLFLRYLDDLNSVTEFIYKSFERKPHPEKHCCFVNSVHNQDFISKNNNEDGPRIPTVFMTGRHK